MFKSVLLFALTVCPAAMLAQALPASDPTTWDLAGGLAVQREASGAAYDYGWSGSLTERPYRTHPWVGGTIEGTGVYNSTTGSPTTLSSSSALYTAMAGPVFCTPVRHVRPFGHVLLGGVIATNSIAFNGLSTYSSTDASFGSMLGGGVDFPLSRHAAVRTQADWLRVFEQNASSYNRLRFTGALVYRF